MGDLGSMYSDWIHIVPKGYANSMAYVTYPQKNKEAVIACYRTVILPLLEILELGFKYMTAFQGILSSIPLPTILLNKFFPASTFAG